MLRLFLTHSLRYFARHPALTALNIVGIALGVTVFLAVQIINHSALESFRASVDIVAGKADLEVIGDGLRTTLNGRTVRVRETPNLAAATLLCSSVLSPARHQNGEAFAALGRCVKQLRTWGDCFGYLLVATGWADIMCDPIMNAWDIAALIPVVRGAGGVITDWQGRDPVNAKSIVAAIPGLHAQVIAALNP